MKSLSPCDTDCQAKAHLQPILFGERRRGFLNHEGWPQDPDPLLLYSVFTDVCEMALP